MRSTADNKRAISDLEVNGLRIELERKKIRNMYLKVLPPEGRIYISAPIRMPIDTIKSFLMSKESWIRLQQERLKSRQATETAGNSEYITGEVVYLWGRKLPLEVRFHQRKNEALLTDSRILLYVKKSEKESTPKERYSILKQMYREELSSRIPRLLSHWEEIIGVRSEDWKLRDMTTRWGTCNVRQKSICLNLKLAQKAPECLKYVIVHELVHLLERSHNHIFKSYMDQFLPDWRHIKARLNGRSSLE